MLNPKHERYAKRLQQLIERGNEIVELAHSSYDDSSYFLESDKDRVQAWLANVEAALEAIMGADNTYMRHLRGLMPNGPLFIERPSNMYPIVGLLKGALDDIENGFLLSQELLLAGDVFDDVLSQAEYLNGEGYKDPAAVLGRVVLEDALRRLARRAAIDAEQKVTAINDNLKKKQEYSQLQWRQIQVWLDIGNLAAHGKFDEYDQQAVSNMLEGIRQFLAVTLIS